MRLSGLGIRASWLAVALSSSACFGRIASAESYMPSSPYAEATALAGGAGGQVGGASGGTSPGAVPEGALPAPAQPALGNLTGVLASLAPEGWVVGAVQVKAPADGAGEPVIAPQTAALLAEYGCIEVAGKFFQRGQRLVIARIYRFKNPECAYGAYTLMRQGSSAAVRRGDASSEDDQSVSIWQDSYFVNVHTTAEDDDEAKELVLAVADKLVAGITEHADTPTIMSRLPQLDRVLGSEKLVMGPLGARRAAHIPYIDVLSINTQGAASADYQFREPNRERLRLLVIAYQSAQAARDAYGRYEDALQDSRISKDSETSSLFKLSDSFLLCQRRGNQITIINGARKRLSPYILARQLNF